MTERIISADSHLELKPEKILGHLPRQHHEAYQGAQAAMVNRILQGKPQKQLKNKPGSTTARRTSSRDVRGGRPSALLCAFSRVRSHQSRMPHRTSAP